MNSQEMIEEFKEQCRNGNTGTNTGNNIIAMLECGYPSEDELRHQLETKDGSDPLNDRITTVKNSLNDVISKINIDEAFYRFYKAIQDKRLFFAIGAVDNRIYTMDDVEIHQLATHVAKEWLNDNGNTTKNTMRGYISTSDFRDLIDNAYLIHELHRYFDNTAFFKWKVKYKVSTIFDDHQYPYSILQEIQQHLLDYDNILDMSYCEVLKAVRNSIIVEINAGNENISLNTIERFDHVDNNYFKEMNFISAYMENSPVDNKKIATMIKFDDGITSSIAFSEYQMNRIKLANVPLINSLAALLTNFAGKKWTIESEHNGTCHIYTFTKDMLNDVTAESLSIANYFIGGNVVYTDIDYNDCVTQMDKLLRDGHVVSASIHAKT